MPYGSFEPEEIEDLAFEEASFSDVRPGAYLPGVHLSENFSDGILGSVLYPTQGLLLFGLHDL